ncbi:MAG: TolC family protein [Pirellulales bacterium]
MAPLPTAVVEPHDRTELDLAIPADWGPWWRPTARQPILGRPERLDIDLDAIVLGSLLHSAQVKVLRDFPAIQETAIAEAHAQFDVHSFVESKFADTSEPVGSTLTTGGPPRYLNQNWFSSGGVRQLGPTGARLEAAQKFGYEDSNSVFFVPDQQGTARLSVSLTQPLLNGAGRIYNTSTVLLAQIDVEIAHDQFSRDLQNVVLDVQRAYWDLYLQRVVLLQKRKLFHQGRRIYVELDARRDVDVVKSQLARAKGAVATRGAAVIRQEALVLNAEARLRTLVNDPVLGSVEHQELVPIQPPIETPQTVGLQDSLILALGNRPEIDLATRELRAARVRLCVSDHELMPVLNLILASYVNGLEGDAAIGKAFEDQFAAGRPSYSAGLLLEYPFGNRAAQARLKRRRLELRQLTNQLEATAANVRLEVETAVREIATAHREMISHYHAILGGEAEIEHLERRWRLLPGDQPAAGIVLDDLLNAQERLSRAEASYADTLVAYNVALVQLKRATGVLLQCQPIETAAHLPRRGSRSAGVAAEKRASADRGDGAKSRSSAVASKPAPLTAKKSEPAETSRRRIAAAPVKWPPTRKGQTAAAWPRATVEHQSPEPRAQVWPVRPDIAPSEPPTAANETLPSLPRPGDQAIPLPTVEGPQLLPPVMEP